ncbi:MAG: cupin domain-containing protein [Deltaproteobacteria bacterium]|nr:cupin domain-containing protein [Deltaproteobacteria bacterium]
MKTRLGVPLRLLGQLWRFRPSEAEAPSHRHALLELEHVIQGRATLAVGGQQFGVEPRSLLWIRPGLEHQLVEYSDDFEMWIACFRPRLVRRSSGRQSARELLGRRGVNPSPRTLSATEARRLCTLLAEVSAYGEPATYNAGLGHLLAHAWLQYRQAER